MNAHLLQPRLSPIPPSVTTDRRNPLSNAINTHVPPEVPPKPASYERNHRLSLARMPEFNHLCRPKSFKTRLVLCDFMVPPHPLDFTAKSFFLSFSVSFLTVASATSPHPHPMTPPVLHRQAPPRQLVHVLSTPPASHASANLCAPTLMHSPVRPRLLA
jgi:hypothetical protein